MGSRAKRPPLPAATESDIGDNGPGTRSEDDVATDISRITDRTSYTIPEDGAPVKIPTKKGKNSVVDKQGSQASLLIDLYETKSKGSGRPSVRVRVSSGGQPIKVTEVNKRGKPSHTRRVSFDNHAKKNSVDLEMGHSHGNSDISNRSPVDVEINNEVNNNASDISSHGEGRMMPAGSDISSMPADSMLEPNAGFKEPSTSHQRSTSELREHDRDDTRDEKPRELSRRRSRSLSRERRARLERKAAEKARLIEGDSQTSSRPRKLRKSRDKSGSNVTSEDAAPSKSRKSSKSHSNRNSGEYGSGTGTESSLRPADAHSNLSQSNGSNLSKSSLANNPKLLNAVEDAIRRLILPEIGEIKRQVTLRDSKGRSNRDSRATDMTRDTDNTERSRDDIKHKKVRRSSRERDHEGRSSRRTSDGTSRDHTERKSKSKTSRHSSRESEGLTAAALKDHDRESCDRDRRERRKHRSKSKTDSRSDSIAQTDEEYYEERLPVPPLPMQSVGDSELTRESIMSADTNDTYDRPASSQKTKTPVQEVARSSPRTIPLPESRGSSKTPLASERTRTPINRDIASPVSVRSQGDRSTKSAKSNKSVSTNARYAALSAAGLGGAAGGLYAQHRDKSDRSRSRQSDRVVEQERDASPVQSDASSRRGDAPAELQLSTRERAAAAADARRQQEHAATQSASSGRSTPDAQYPATQKRHQGVNLSESDIIGGQEQSYDPNAPVGHRNFDASNEPVRDSEAFDDKRASGFTDWSGARQSWSDSLGSPLPGRDFSEQHVRGIAANPQLMDNSFQAQSETGSMVNPSQLSSYRGTAEPSTQSFAAQSFKDREQARDGGRNKGAMMDGPANDSQDRWRWLKENAKARTSSQESVGDAAGTRDIKDEDNVKLGASGLPDADHPMPEIGYARDDEAITNPSLRGKASSVLEGPLGDENENRDHWPYEPTPDIRRRQGYPDEDRDEQYASTRNAAPKGPAAGLGIENATAGRGMQQDEQREPSERSKSQASHAESYSSSLQRDQHLSPGNMKDEGYISAANPRSQDSFSKPPPGVYGGRNRGFGSMADEEDAVAGKGSRYAQNKRGMSSGYDAATGQGINGIQSADVVALMDHLSVRDGQRSARDSELIVTLVRSASEMRENFDQVKKLVELQSTANLKNQDKNTDRLMSRILGGGPKPQILGSPRTPTAGSTEDVPAKKQNIFKRALKGLSSKSSNDVTRIEDMLVQLLDEVEALKSAQAISAEPPTTAGAPRGSFDIEQQRLQQVPDPGYEPEGQAGTGSTPSHSGYFSPQQSRRSGPQMHSGFGAGSNRVSGNRVSTVYEEEQEVGEEPERMMTPTQESQRHRSVSFNTPTAPQRPSGETQFEMSPNVPFTSPDRNDRKSSKTFSFPKISRWSKTTEDSSTDKRFSTETAGNERPYSQAFSQESQSGEHVNTLPGADGRPWDMHEDDRLRSANSLARESGEQQRAQSPLIPSDAQQRNEVGQDEQYGEIPIEGLDEASPESAENPKYTSHRGSLVALAHPQPRQGPTGRHHNRLETEAYGYSPSKGSPAQDHYQRQSQNRDQREDSDRGSSPDNELFGSVPALARGPMAHRRHAPSNGYGSTPWKANGMMSPPTTGSTSQSDPNSPNVAQRQQAQTGPPRPPKIQGGPVIPPKIALNGNVGQQRQDQQRGYGFPQSQNTDQLTPQYSQERTRDGVSPAHSDSAHSRTNTMSSTIPSSSELSLAYEDDEGSPSYPMPHLERKRSPYMPGGPLAPIEERYSMEGDRSSIAHSLSQRSRVDRDGPPPGSRSGQHSRAQSGVEQYLADMAEGDENERALTPTRSPRPALGAEDRGGETRKLTGPREMPGGMKGTVRRKPVSAELGSH